MAAIRILSEGRMLATHTLDAVGFTKANFGVVTNTTLSSATPVGVLAGTVAAQKAGAALVAVPGSMTTVPLGLFVKSASGSAWDANPALASGKLTIASLAVVEVDVYETRNAANSANLTYAEGDKLYSSAQGFLTKEVSTEGTVIGVVIKAPTVGNATMQVKMLV